MKNARHVGRFKGKDPSVTPVNLWATGATECRGSDHRVHLSLVGGVEGDGPADAGAASGD